MALSVFNKFDVFNYSCLLGELFVKKSRKIESSLDPYEISNSFQLSGFSRSTTFLSSGSVFVLALSWLLELWPSFYFVSHMFQYIPVHSITFRAVVLPSWFELHQIAGCREGARQCRIRGAQIQARLHEQSWESPKADSPEREANVSFATSKFMWLISN